MGQDPPPTGNIRIGDSERDAVVAVLQKAAEDGRLSMAELDDRLGAALQAKTYADLDPLVADLPVELPSRTLSSSRPRAQRPPSAGLSPRGSPPSRRRNEQREAPGCMDYSAFHRHQPGIGVGKAQLSGGDARCAADRDQGDRWSRVDRARAAGRLGRGRGPTLQGLGFEVGEGSPGTGSRQAVTDVLRLARHGRLKVRPPNRFDQRGIAGETDHRELGR